MNKLGAFIFLLGTSMYTMGNNQKMPELVSEISSKAQANPIKVRYTNYRGETAVRLIIPLRFSFGSTEYHPHEQWLLEVWDVEKNALRVYALKDISQWFVE